MDSLSNNVAVRGQATPTIASAPPPAADRTGWLDGLKGISGRVSQAFSSTTPEEKPAPKVGIKDHLLKLVDSNHLSPQERDASYARIRQAADNLRTQKPGQSYGQAAGMTLDDAKKLRNLADASGDKELQREADFVTRMLTDHRPSQQTPEPAPAPVRGHNRIGSDAQCAASVARANSALRGQALQQAVYDGCG